MLEYTTLSLRNSSLNTELKRFGNLNKEVNSVIDSTGLVVHGEGRRTRHKHGKRKLHGWQRLCLRVSYILIVAIHLIDERECDGTVAPTLIG